MPKTSRVRNRVQTIICKYFLCVLILMHFGYIFLVEFYPVRSRIIALNQPKLFLNFEDFFIVGIRYGISTEFVRN